MSSLDVVLPSVLVPCVVVMIAVVVGAWWWTRTQLQGRGPSTKSSKLDKAVQVTAENFEVDVVGLKRGPHIMEEGLVGKSVLLAAEIGFNDEQGDRWIKSRVVENAGWDSSILLGKDDKAVNGYHDEIAEANGEHQLAMLPSNLEIGGMLQENITPAEYSPKTDTDEGEERYIDTVPELQGQQRIEVEKTGNGNYLAVPINAGFIGDVPAPLSSDHDEIPFLSPNPKVDQSVLMFNAFMPNGGEQRSPGNGLHLQCQRLHPDTMLPITDDARFYAKPSPAQGHNYHLQHEDTFGGGAGGGGGGGGGGGDLDSSYDLSDPATPRRYHAHNGGGGGGGSALDSSADGGGQFGTPRSGGTGGGLSPAGRYGSRSKQRGGGQRRGGGGGGRQNRDQIIRLHKQIFSEKSEGGNMCTPVELPGDNGVSFYRGASSLMGVMLSAAADEAPVNTARKATADDEEMWG